MEQHKLNFLSTEVVELARSLIGCELHSRIDGKHCCGLITETEAYKGVADRASHAWGGRRTGRTSVMYNAGGIAYVYFTYGMHHLFNIVTGPAEVPHAILIRAIWPVCGLEFMLERRKKAFPAQLIANGPAKLCQAMGINLKHNGLKIGGELIWIVEKPRPLPAEIRATARIGVDYAGDDALLPYRFVWDKPQLLS